MKLFPTALASVFVLGSLCAAAGELTAEEKTELRSRADKPPAERVSVQDDVKLNRNQGDVRLDKQPSDVKAKPASAKPAKGAKAKSKVKKKKRRSLKDVPGALVR